MLFRFLSMAVRKSDAKGLKMFMYFDPLLSFPDIDPKKTARDTYKKYVCEQTQKKPLTKIYCSFRIKAVSQLGIEGYHFRMIEGTCRHSTELFPPTIGRLYTQQEARRETETHKYWKRRSKTVPICR